MEFEKNLSYEKNMKLDFESINENFKKERNIGKILLYIFSEKNNLENEYANGIKNICELYYNNYGNNNNEKENENKSSLKISIESLLNEIINESNIHFDNVKNIEDNVIKPFGILLENQLKKGKELSENIHSSQNSFKKVIDNLNNIQSQFISSTKYAESAIMSYEKEVYNANNENKDEDNPLNNQDNIEDNNSLKNDIEKIEEIQKKNLQTAKELENQYKNYITEANNEREHFINSSIEIYNIFQEMDENYINELQNYFLKITQCYIEMYNRLFDSKKNKIKIYNSINAKEDIKKFINENQTNYNYPSKFQFVPYSPEIRLRIGNDTKEKEQYEIARKTLSIMNELFKYVPEEFKDNPEMEKNYLNIEESVKNIWKGENLDNEYLFKLFDYSSYRMQFLFNVNRFRAEGLFYLEKNSFNNLCSIMNYLLKKSYEQEDYQCIKFTMILSQTFFLGKETNILVQDVIQKNEFFQEEKIWEGLIEYSINEEINNQKNYCNFLNENKESREKRINSVGYGNLFTFWYNMKIFGLPIQNCKNVIRKFSEKYNINENEIFSCEILDNQIKDEIIVTSTDDNIQINDLN